MRLIAPIFALLILAPAAAAQVFDTNIFPEATEVFRNPERGFYDYCVEARGAVPVAIQAEACSGNVSPGDTEGSDGTLVFRYYLLDAFRDTPISQAYLQRLADDFDEVREAGLKLIPRFAYALAPDTTCAPEDKVHGFCTPFRDEPLSTVERHIGNLAGVLAEHADVILTVQMGFIGAWGEGYYTDYFVEDPLDPSTISASKMDEREAVLRTLLDAVPTTRTVQIRYPFHKPDFTGTTQPLSDAQAFRGDLRSRTGFHNDCTLADATDFGTYRSEEERAYAAKETRNLPMGGETCQDTTYAGCDNALAQLARFHYTYLNWDYNQDVHDRWRSDSDPCFETIRKRLGYRLVLDRVQFTPTVRPGSALFAAVTLRNDGFAAPINRRSAYLVLQRGQDEPYLAPLRADVRRWYPGAIDEALEAGVPADAPAGTYDLSLWMPDDAATLRNDPRYAIRLQNTMPWRSGRNVLGAVTLDASASGASHNGSVVFRRQSVVLGTDAAERPAPLHLGVPAPHPIRSTATFTLDAPRAETVTVALYDALGHRVTSLYAGPGGRVLRLALDASSLAPGVYFVRVATPSAQTTRGIVVAR